MASSQLSAALRGSQPDDTEDDSTDSTDTSLPSPSASPSGVSSALSAASSPALDAAIAKQGERGEAAYAKAQEASKTMEGLSDELTSLKPPEYKAPPPAPEAKHTNPLEAFGSIASMAAIFGSLMTRQPLTAALNNASGVMEAYQANDKERAKEEFDRWKVNVENAQTLFKFQNDQYANALKNIDTKGQMAMNSAKLIAASLDDPAMKLLIEQGRLKDAVELQGRRQELFEKFSKASVAAEDAHHNYMNYQEAKNAQTTALGRPLTPQEDQAIYNEYMLKPSRTAAQSGKMTFNQAVDNARQEFEKKYGRGPSDQLIYKSLNPDKEVPDYDAYQKKWLSDHKGQIIGQETTPTQPQPQPSAAGTSKSSSEPPPSRMLPPQFQSRPDGTFFKNDGWKWEKRGTLAVPVEKISAAETPAATKTAANGATQIGGYTVKRNADGSLTVIPINAAA